MNRLYKINIPNYPTATIGHISTPKMTLERVIVVDFTNSGTSLVIGHADGTITTHPTALKLSIDFWNFIHNFNTRIRL